MTVVSGGEVVAEGRIEHGELSDAISQASTFLDWEEGKLRGLCRADIIAVLMKSLGHVPNDVGAWTILVVAIERIAVQSL